MNKKRCSETKGCGELKDLVDFSWKDKGNGKFSHVCKDCDNDRRNKDNEWKRIKEDCKISLEWLSRPIALNYYEPIHQ